MENKSKYDLIQDCSWNPYNENYDFINSFKKFVESDNSLEVYKNDGVVKDIAPKRIIYKYNIEKSNIINEHIEQILDVQIQNDTIMAWILINPLFPETKVRFDLVGTGWPYADRRSQYLRTLQDGNLVWHVFVRKDPAEED